MPTLLIIPMAFFRKKPVVIQAWSARELIRAASLDWDSLPKAVAAAYEQGGWVFSSSNILIPTLEGSMAASIDDMVLCGVNGEFYPCKPDIFAKTYEPVEGTFKGRVAQELARQNEA